MAGIHLVRASVGGLAVVVAALGALSAAPPPAGPSATTEPPLEIPEAALKSGTGYEEQVGARIKHWAEVIRSAKDPGVEDAVIKARNGLVADYAKYDNARYQFLFARESARQLTPLLGVADQYKHLKQVNVAMALARMTSASIQEALDKMVSHENPAVRYLGWQGYRASRTVVMGQSLAAIARMFQTLKDRADKETSAPAMGAMFQCLRLPARPQQVSERDYQEAQKKAAEVLLTCWRKRCEQTWAGDAEMTEMCRAGVDAWAALADHVAADKDLLKKALQSLLDLAWCAAKPFAQTALSEVEMLLLQDCEGALNAIKKTQKKYIESPLEPGTPAQRSAVGSGILKWVADLKEDGAAEPKFQTPTTTSAPATTPAATAPTP